MQRASDLDQIVDASETGRNRLGTFENTNTIGREAHSFRSSDCSIQKVGKGENEHGLGGLELINELFSGKCGIGWTRVRLNEWERCREEYTYDTMAPSVCVAQITMG